MIPSVRRSDGRGWSAACACRVRVPRARAACACRVRVPSARAACACRVRVPRARAACACRVRVPGARAGCACRVRVPRASAACECRVRVPSASAECEGEREAECPAPDTARPRARSRSTSDRRWQRSNRRRPRRAVSPNVRGIMARSRGCSSRAVGPRLLGLEHAGRAAACGAQRVECPRTRIPRWGQSSMDACFLVISDDPGIRRAFYRKEGVDGALALAHAHAHAV